MLERRLRTRRGGGRVVRIDEAEQTDLLATRQEIEIVNVPGVDETVVPGADDSPRR